MNEIPKYKAFDIPVDEIFVDLDFNCRGSFSLSSVDDLAKSITESGLDVPVVVQPISDTGLKIKQKWRLLAGFRRFAACTDILRWKTIPARIEHDLTEEEAFRFNFRENVERKNLHPLEEAQWVAKHFPNGSIREIAKAVGRDTRWVHQRVRLNKLPAECQHKFASGMLSLLDVESLAKLPTPEEQNRAADLIIEAKRKRDWKELPKLRRAREFQPRKTKEQIGRMINRLMVMGQDGLVTRFGAWCAGWITDKEFEKDLRSINCANEI